MTRSHPLIIVPDTDILLHYQPLDQLPWRQLAGDREIEVVLVTQVLRELDAKKWGDSDRLRERARRVFAELRRWLPPGILSTTLTNEVALRMVISEPLIGDNLDRTVGDDRILASMVELATGKSVALMTDDYVLSQKAAARGYELIAPPDSHRLVDKGAKKGTRPAALKVGLVTELGHVPSSHVELVLDGNAGDYRHVMEARVAAVRSGQRSMEYLLGPHFAFHGIEAPTLQDFEKFIDELRAFEQKLTRVVQFGIAISNEGDEPADDARAEILFPSALEVSDIPPVWPARPEIRALEVAGKLNGDGHPSSRVSSKSAPFLMDWTEDFRRRRLRIHVERLMQTKQIARRLWAWPEAHVGGFSIDVELLAASPARRQQVSLNVRVVRPTSLASV